MCFFLSFQFQYVPFLHLRHAVQRYRKIKGFACHLRHSLLFLPLLSLSHTLCSGEMCHFVMAEKWQSEKLRKGRNGEQLCISSGMSTYRFMYISMRSGVNFSACLFLTRCVKTVKRRNTKTENSKKNSRKYLYFFFLVGLPFSAVSCFSAGRSMAAGNTAGSERPFELNA